MGLGWTREAALTLALGSVLLWLLNLASAALIAGRRRAGRLVALAAQIPGTWHDLRTRQPGFLLLTLICVPVYVRGWRTARNLAPPAVRHGWRLAGRGNGWHPRRRGDAHPGRARAPGCLAAILPRPGIPFAGRAMDPSPAGPEPALHPGQAPGRRAAVTAGEQITRHCAG